MQSITRQIPSNKNQSVLQQMNPIQHIDKLINVVEFQNKQKNSETRLITMISQPNYIEVLLL